MMETLIKLTQENGIDLDKSQVTMFEKYLELLLKWNRVYNLTSIRKKEEIIIKHFFDSLTLVKLFQSQQIDPSEKDIADFGTGAGFPGVPLKIYYKNINLYLIESVGKKCIFLENLRRELNVDFTVLCKRAQEVDRRFDIVVSRATGEIFDVLKIGKNLLKEGGYIVVMKGRQVEEELKDYTVSIQFKGFTERKFVVIRRR